MFAHNFFLLKVEFSRFVFSPRHSPNKFGFARGLSKTLIFILRFLASA